MPIILHPPWWKKMPEIVTLPPKIQCFSAAPRLGLAATLGFFPGDPQTLITEVLLTELRPCFRANKVKKNNNERTQTNRSLALRWPHCNVCTPACPRSKQSSILLLVEWTSAEWKVLCSLSTTLHRNRRKLRRSSWNAFEAFYHCT